MIDKTLIGMMVGSTLEKVTDKDLSNEEVKEIYEDIEADYWIGYEKENPEIFDQKEISMFFSFRM